VEAEIELVASGGITSPKGFYAGAAYAGIKKKVDNVLDLGVLYSQASSATAA
jgi:glutamate N-acetyltransferase/amino-acid N-acetyltransferase